MADIRQSIHFANYLKRQGWTVERIGEINYFIKKFPIIGSILKVQRPEEIQIDIVRKLIRKYRIFQIIIEPKTELDAKFLASIGFRLSKSPYLPSKTLQIDLTQPRKKIFAHIKKDARYSIKRGESLLIKSYSTPDEIRTWREAWKNSVNYKRYVPPVQQLINLRKSFPSTYSLFLASHNISGRIIGGVLFTRSSHDFAYYWYGFTNSEGRTSLAQYSLLYQGILWAEKMGCKIFDFEGVYDSRFPNKSWLGFSHFKRSFGGYEVEYPGCFIQNRLPI
ncbi:MAG: GNAT family N-acetyltransferase [Candidatus Microgenomates bacterium]|jgi:lipid II:glycine glycyltransferase (peptidoglycan interpeptide bridge formation enzyme)